MTVRLAAIVCLLCVTARAEPARVVSLNPCLDTILIAVADRSQIAALSHFSRNRRNFTIADVAAATPVTGGTAEEVIALQPDLVLASLKFPPAAETAYRELAIRTEILPITETVTDSIAQIRAVADLVGRPDRGAAVISDIEQALDRAAPPAGAAPVEALVFQSGGFASAPATLMDELMRRAGFANVAPRYGLVHSGSVALERLIADPPRVLLADEPGAGQPPWVDRVVRHPALAALEGRVRWASYPAKYLYCGGPVMIPALDALRVARLQTAMALP